MTSPTPTRLATRRYAETSAQQSDRAKRLVLPQPTRLLKPDSVNPVPPSTSPASSPGETGSSDRFDRDASDDAPRTIPDDGIKRTGAFAYVVRREGGRLRLAPAWPLWALLVPFPVTWALGLSTFIFVMAAVPMLIALLHRRPIRRPPGFWLWTMFLVWTVLSLSMFRASPRGTIAGTTFGRSVSIATSLIEYAAVTVMLLFVGNLTARELPVDRLIRWLSVLFLVTVFGGFLGTFAPWFSFNSPLELLLPSSFRTDPYIASLVHPVAAQSQAVLDTGGGRAAAPFGYTNFWANNLSILLIWFVVSWGIHSTSVRRIACVGVVCASLVPTIYSLNRGLWIGLVVTLLWVAIRLFLQGRIATLFTVLALLCVGGALAALTPLGNVVNARINRPDSNSIRSFLTSAAIEGANQSPVIGWGGTRKTVGSYQSIAVGKTPWCPLCGQAPIGSNGQLWAVIFNTGYVGAAFYFGFFGYTVWTYRRERQPAAQAGQIVVALTFVYMLFYDSLPSSVALTMISVGILWRCRQDNQLPTSRDVGRRLPAPTRSMPVPADTQ